MNRFKSAVNVMKNALSGNFVVEINLPSKRHKFGKIAFKSESEANKNNNNSNYVIK